MNYGSQKIISLSFFAALAGLFVAPVVTMAYQAAPFAITKNATYITEKGAQLNGGANPGEMPDALQWFEWGISGRSTVVYETQHNSVGGFYIGGGNSMVNTSATISGLAPNTQYFYRQVVENSRGRDTGVTTYFTTKPLIDAVTPIVIVETKQPGAVGETTAKLRGYMAPHGNNAAKWWFEWGATTKLENTTSASGSWGDSKEVETVVTGLTPGTPYFYRIVGENGFGNVYGMTTAFVTNGTPPPPLETARAQDVPELQASTDGVSRKVTTNATQGTGSSVGYPGSGTYRPGNVLAALFGNRQPAASTEKPAGEAGAGVATQGQDSSLNQTASVGATSPLGAFWGALSPKKPVEVVIEKVGPKVVPAHTPVEYRVTYTYRLSEPANNAVLKLTLAGSVIYIGDNTVNELLLEEGVGPERTYDLPIGRLENGHTRTVSILGMTTGDAKNTFPDARARIEYTDRAGVTRVVAAVNAEIAGGQVAGAGSASSSGTALPHSIISWVLYILLLGGIIMGIRKAKAYYDERKEALAQEDTLSQHGGGFSPHYPEHQVPA